MRKQWKYKPYDRTVAKQLVEEVGVSPAMAVLLVHRGVHSKEQATQYFNPSLDHLHDPFLLKNMSLGVKRLDEAIANEERILLYGDYDVDGVTSVSLLYLFLKRFTTNIDFYIPDRYKEGYGLSPQGMDFAKQNKVKLIIAMDCGTTAHAAIDIANEKGIDVLVLDHHTPDKKIPKAILINPKQVDCEYPFEDLSGCGVTFKFAQAYAQHKQMDERALLPLLDLVAISIACDYVPIRDENRAMAALGLEQLNQRARVGLKALITKTNYTYPFSISDIVFGIGPYINAAGRLSDGKEAVRLLLAEDWLVAAEYAKILKQRNEQRRVFDRKNLEEAIVTWEQNEAHLEVPIIFLFQANWHKGVLGIVASRMAKQYHKPAIIMCESNGEVVASARSVAGIDLRKILSESEHLFGSFGGHPSAAGFTMNPQHLSTLSENLLKSMQSVTAEQKIPILEIDAELELSEITPNFLKDLRKLQPTGPGNPNPLFVCENVEVAGPIRYVENANLRLLVQKENSGIFKAVGFRKGDFVGQIDSPYFSMCYKIIERDWKGKKQIQLQMKDVIEEEVRILN